jgi:hypothetical protein
MLHPRTRRLVFLGAALILAGLLLKQVAPAWITPAGCNVHGTCPNNSGDLGKWCTIVDGSLYSGTSASIHGKWTGGSGDPLKKVELWVNGVRRYYKTWSSGYPDVWPAGTGCTSWLAVPFSTTQFADGATLTLKAKLWTKNNVYKEATDDAHNSWNRAYVLQNRDLGRAETICNHSNSKCSSMNHTSPGPYDSDDVQDIVGSAGNWGGRLKLFSVFHAYTHGDSGNFGDCYAPCDETEDCNVARLEAQMAVNAKEDANKPDYNFVFLDSCYSASTAWFDAFDTTSYLGWVGLSYDTEQYENWIKAFWDGLATKKTVAQARAYAFSQEGSITNDSGLGNQGYRVHRTY